MIQNNPVASILCIALVALAVMLYRDTKELLTMKPEDYED
jgi:putative effector of murein hydrolase